MESFGGLEFRQFLVIVIGNIMPFRGLAVGRPEEVTHPDALKAALAEGLSTLIFVFAGEGSATAFGNTLSFSFSFQTTLHFYFVLRFTSLQFSSC